MQWFCQNVCVLIEIQNMHKLDETILDLVSNSVTVDLHIFDTLMENKVCSYIRGRFIIIRDLSGCLYLNV